MAAHGTSGAEKAVLLACLGRQRRHIIDDLDGRDDDALGRRVLPSAWNGVGLVQHLTRDVERIWFRCVVAGESGTITETIGSSSAWDVDPTSPPPR